MVRNLEVAAISLSHTHTHRERRGHSRFVDSIRISSLIRYLFLNFWFVINFFDLIPFSRDFCRSFIVTFYSNFYSNFYVQTCVRTLFSNYVFKLLFEHSSERWGNRTSGRCFQPACRLLLGVALLAWKLARVRGFGRSDVNAGVDGISGKLASVLDFGVWHCRHALSNPFPALIVHHSTHPSTLHIFSKFILQFCFHYHTVQHMEMS